MTDTARLTRLFADLESQLAAAESAELSAEVAERTRAEIGKIRLFDRLLPAIGQHVRVWCRGGDQVLGTVHTVGIDWFVITELLNRSVLIPFTTLASVSGLESWSAPPMAEGQVVSKLTFRHAVRAIVRDRAASQVTLIDGSVVSGTLDRVGADFLEMAEHFTDEPRRSGVVQQIRTIPLSAIVFIRTRTQN